MPEDLQTTEPQKTRTDRIIELHNEIVGAVRMTLAKAIEIGALLQEQKDSLSHGEWIPWTVDHLPFDLRSAQRYMRAHTMREQIECDSVSSLADAYELLNEREAAPISPRGQPPEIPADWDYDESVKKMRKKLIHTDELARELLGTLPELLSAALARGEKADVDCFLEAIADSSEYLHDRGLLGEAGAPEGGAA